MHPVRSRLVVRGQLLPQATTAPLVLLPVVVPGRLLPETAPILLLAGASAILPLPAEVAGTLRRAVRRSNSTSLPVSAPRSLGGTRHCGPGSKRLRYAPPRRGGHCRSTDILPQRSLATGNGPSTSGGKGHRTTEFCPIRRTARRSVPATWPCLAPGSGGAGKMRQPAIDC